MSAFIHPSALCESSQVGDGTRVWAFAHVLPGAIIGRDCNICDGVFVENDVRVGDRVTLKCGVQLWDGITLEDDVFVGPNATFANDAFPRSRQKPASYLRTAVGNGRRQPGAHRRLRGYPGIGRIQGDGGRLIRARTGHALATQEHRRRRDAAPGRPH